MLKFLKFANQMRGKFEYQTLEKATTNPEPAQTEFLLGLLDENAESRFGKQHNFGAIQSISDFRRNIPIRDYEGFRPYINQIISGERSVLTERDPFMFTLTSGTTDEPKYIPVTKRSQELNSSLMRKWLYRAECDHKGLTAKASVGIVSRAVEGLTASGIPFGSASGVIYKNIPWFIRRAYAVPYAVSEIEDYDERYFVLARFALAQRVSFIATPNPTTLLRLARIVGENCEDLIGAIYDGTLGIKLNGQPKLQAELSSLLRPNPQQAWEISAAIDKTGRLRLADCWSDLRMIGCWLGGSVGIQAGKLSAHFGDVPLRDLGYLASEGNFTLPFENDRSSGILAIQNNYYEFITEGEIENQNPTILSAHELEIGKRYEILLTTAAGLYRYKINDIIEVTGFYKCTPVIAFVRKAGEMANITGEKMHVNHIVQAFETVRRRFDLNVEQFRVVPDLENCRYEIFVEIKENGFLDLPGQQILNALDDELQHVNMEYKQKRKSGRLAPPVVFQMKRGWAESGLRRHVADGKRDTQYKPQILCAQRNANDHEFIDETIKIEISKPAQASALSFV